MKKGISLPLWIAASAKSAVKNLLGFPFEEFELIKNSNSNQVFSLKIHSAANIQEKSKSLAITFADSGLDLDLTRNLEIWCIVDFEPINDNKLNKENLINIIPGEGVGISLNTKKICISDFAKSIISENLLDLIPFGYELNLNIIFPNGKFLAERTSNKSFGIVEGLSIIGTSADTYASASQEQIKNAKAQLDIEISQKSNEIIIFVIGENGLDLAKKYFKFSPIIKIGNWIGPLLIYAAAKEVKKVLLFGYHGKLIKVAGGVFHTHNHIADARIEILVYLAFNAKLPDNVINRISLAKTIEEALIIAEEFNLESANFLWTELANAVEVRSKEYISKYLDSPILIGSAIFDRNRKIRWKGNNGRSLFSKLNTFKQ
ncbi:MAG: cobalt-precorrin-5B (C(1))-methyltransferase [Prochlorococcus sp. SP3034]|nr:cobalt-precorrin-5B (C(1))-methyltransferase [Prochlorococcus sp. SP3034]